MTARRAPIRQDPTRRAIDSFTEIATLRIELKDTDPPIWRVIEAPTSITLKVLHDIVQASMGWFDYHLWEFIIGGQTYGLPMDEDWGTAPRKPAARTRLRDVLTPDTTRIDYTYDFGDNWELSLIVSDVRAGDPSAAYPRFIAGERNGPPEDCGGIPGFYDKLDARADPRHPDHAEIAEWLEDYDPDELDVPLIQAALSRIAARRNSAATRIIKPAKN
jgi:hypothetical protein